MAKFEIEKRVRTPDGVIHPSREAAQAHMKALAVETVGSANATSLRDAMSFAGTQEAHVPSDIAVLRDAIRDLYLMTWPRAPKGSKTPPAASAEPSASTTTRAEPLVEEPGTSDPSPAVAHDEPHEGSVVELAPMDEPAHEPAHPTRSRKKG